MIDYRNRLRAVQSQMTSQGIDLLFLSRSANLHYVTGIGREEPNFGNTIYPGEWLAGAWIPRSGSPILTLPRMLAEFHLGDVADHNVRILADDDDPMAVAKDVLRRLEVGTDAHVAVEDRAWAELVLNLRRLLPAASFTLASALLAPLRLIKSEEEVALMRRAGEITELAYAATLTQLRHGMTTLDLITEMNYQLKVHGATGPSFVTSFYNMGEHFPFDFTNREACLRVPLDPPVSVSFDFGAVYAGYCYDFGRSVYFGEPNEEYRRAYALVMEAQAVGIAALRAGNTCEQADAAARAVIVEGGYGEAFRHRLGHGIGMDVHEPPFLTAGDTTTLRPGMAFTVEPSIFMPLCLGARVEDVVIVREQGGEALTSGFQSLHVVA